MKKNFRILFRIIHRDLSYFFSGVILIYAISGFILNHKADFNAEYDISRKEYKADGSFPISKQKITKEYVLQILDPINQKENYTKHYFPQENQMKVFLKGGSSLILNTENGYVLYECIKKRPVISAINRLHYNPNLSWTIFSDIFSVCLIIITITGIFMIKGSKGLLGRGGIELAIGILIPLLFVFF